MRISLPAVVVLAMSICLLPLSSASADWTEDFDGGFDQTWMDANATLLGGSSGTFSASIVSDVYRMEDPTDAASLSGAVVGVAWVNEVFTDVRVGATVNPRGVAGVNNDIGVFARGDTGAFTSYFALLDYNNGTLELFRSDGPGTPIQLDASTPIDSFDMEGSYYIELDAVGDNLAGRVYDSQGGSLLRSVSAIDAAYASGHSGLTTQVSNTGSPLLGEFDNVSSVAVPEPGTLGLAAAGLLLLAPLALRLRRRHRQ